MELSKLLNIKYESIKSIIKTHNKDVTTELVVDCPTPFAPPVADNPQ